MSAALVALTAVAYADQLPNDVDLKAMYCLGAIKAFKSGWQAPDPNTIPPGTIEQIMAARNKMLRDVDEAAQKLRGYMLPRMQYLDGDSLVLANSQGVADFNRAKSSQQSCSASCGYADQCLTQCWSTPLVTRVMACLNEPTFLPY